MKKDVHTSLRVLRACRAMLFEVREEASSVVSCRCVVGDGAGHATQQHNIIPRQIEEEVGGCLISNGGLEDLLLSTDGQPLPSPERVRGEKDSPVNRHAFGVIVDKVRQQ